MRIQGEESLEVRRRTAANAGDSKGSCRPVSAPVSSTQPDLEIACTIDRPFIVSDFARTPILC